MDEISPLKDSIFLPPEPSLSELWLALRLHHQSWFLHCSRESEDQSILRIGDIQCTSSHCAVPSGESIQEDQTIDSIMDWYRSHCEKEGAVIWFLHPDVPKDINARLYARGVCPNWRPHWMWMSLQDFEHTAHASDNLTIQITPETSNTHENPDFYVWKTSAFRDGQWLGGCKLHVTTGPLGIGGLFDMYVKPEERRQGIGAALARSTCELARKLGCWQVMLNATAEGTPVYTRVGFQSLGMGRTWFLKSSVLKSSPSSDEMVGFLEAVGKGDLPALENMKGKITQEQMQIETRNGETPLEITVRCKKPQSAEWLIRQGLVPDIMSLWDLDWRKRIPALLAGHPEMVRRKAGKWCATPLHYAIERGDWEMVQLLLSVPNDMEAKDGVFEATPVQWARKFERRDIIELLESHKEMRVLKKDLVEIPK